MPPKKKEEEKKILLGRPGNSLKSGIVGWKLTQPCGLSLINADEISGWARQRWEVNSVPSHYQMHVG